ncbi:flavodoxin [Shewanella intestini]|uniref:Flavodoxin n=1 Tax=Shewanella intestini TaxID=2017544 RepID=A0ABS5HYB9_9GAMM|nr:MULTISPECIES: flavodoxin [Shewanella]MBR9726782.1 flavodoxin [Shewanella intestini]MRG34652.1 flavodoxin [Shewanella sp. XMDDZSB0408]
MQKVNIVFGTVYGDAEKTAETVNQAITALGYASQILLPAELTAYTPSAEQWLIVVTSTTGNGDLPDNIEPWFQHLKELAPYSPELKYSVIGLGDSSYEMFCGAAEKVDALLQELGAQPLTQTLKIDACETMDPQQEAKQWISTWHGAAQLLAEA